MSTSSKCSVCKKRTAIYKRTYSGDLLCEACLERSLMKSVKKAIGKYKVLNPMSKVLVPITYTAPHFSAALAWILSLLEKKFSTEVIIARPLDIELDEVKSWPPPGSKELLVRVIDKGVNLRSPSSCIRFDRRWSVKLSRTLGIKTVALPFTRTDLIIFALNALLVEGIDVLSEALELVKVNDVDVFSGFLDVEGEVVSAYVAVKGLWFYSDKCRYKVPARQIFFSVAGKRPELEFSKDKTLLPILNNAFKHLKTCDLCGGFTLKGNICRYCEKTYVDVYIEG